MKMWKKAASIALVSALTVSMAACGNGGGSDKGSADADTFKIGGIGPTTGDAAIYGTAVQNGIQLAIDEINEAGGINGYQIEFKFEDDQSDSEKSVNAYNTLKDWGMQMLVGTRYHIAVVQYKFTDLRCSRRVECKSCNTLSRSRNKIVR